MEELAQLGIVPVNVSVLRSFFSSYSFPNDKILLLEDQKKLIRLKKGLYIVAPDVSGELISVELIANHLYGPSYVSMESALRYYGLIPEKVYTIRSSTTNRSRKFMNIIGTFQYVSVYDDYYSVGINQVRVNNRITFLIASPEKALCDLIITTPHLNFQSAKALEIYLNEDLRLDMQTFSAFNPAIVSQCVETGKKRKALELLLKLLIR